MFKYVFAAIDCSIIELTSKMKNHLIKLSKIIGALDSEFQDIPIWDLPRYLNFKTNQ